ncbi:LruC domain-containing protein [Photobacterium sp. SDRW27]|uniref:LruC domain-containing protein n=1 Tax=Photobacterium obscurum TaxID=2829490 RepID=UPI00224437F9|nr:LruC domain-containing protein [Photobacterium obscurum]MCW8328542.1 LruC domain-containing protein [Photobacterium obscurum]
MNRIIVSALLFAVSLSPLANAEVVSVQLKDTIKQGVGSIDLFSAKQKKNDLSAADLEAMRLENSGALVFAVDVNEAANGTEKASSQGVAIEAAVLTIVIGGTTSTFSSYSTPTESMLAKIGTTERSRYYTLIGQTGSSLITPSSSSDLNGTSYDALITIPVNIALDSATSAMLDITLLETNTSLGDPEAFYDFTAGFEDVALVSVEDSTYLAALVPGQDEAPLVITQGQVQNGTDSWVYYPSSVEYYIAAYEDNYPVKSDYDFNDLVVAYRVGYGMEGGLVSSLIVYGYIIARGSGYTHDWYLHIGLPDDASGTGTLNLFKPDSVEQVSGYPKSFSQSGSFDQRFLKGTKSLMQIPGLEFANTEASESLIKGHKFSAAFDFDSPLDLTDIAQPPYDPYLHVTNTGYEIHLPEHASRLGVSVNSSEGVGGFKNEQGYPFVVIIPEDWEPPLERVDLGEAYSTFLGYVSSSGEQDTSWYLAPATNKIKGIGKAFWKWD